MTGVVLFTCQDTRMHFCNCLRAGAGGGIKICERGNGGKVPVPRAVRRKLECRAAKDIQ